MSSRILRGRRKADSVRPNPFISISKAVASNASGAGRQAAVIAAASGLVLTGSIAAHAAETPVQRDSSPATVAETVAETPNQVVTAASTATVNFERPAVASVAAPVIEKPAPVAAAPVAKTAAATATVQAAAPAPAATAPAAAPAVGGINAAMVASAYAQIGIFQDCTAMVERALGSAGIPVGDLGPMQFMNYGKVVSDPQPGDMIVQSGHVAIYIGNGQAISGGINGNQTGIHPISWLTATGPITYVRAGA
ncbi:NlpC/P60 family protein [Paenarthrobacter sp. NPDC092416]|uniref:NlpC/P60 family protein n=1 Tax=Paenarthrobacter sp. NPDC092416 TaxID=3364386 RepID=UPI0037F26439